MRWRIRTFKKQIINKMPQITQINTDCFSQIILFRFTRIIHEKIDIENLRKSVIPIAIGTVAKKIIKS